jgi:molybdenum transport protein
MKSEATEGAAAGTSGAEHDVSLGVMAYRIPDEEVRHYVEEDYPYGDLTTTLLGIGDSPGKIMFTTRHETVVCCTEEAARLLERLDCHVTGFKPSGTRLGGGQVFLTAEGPASGLHAGWKAALNLLEAASGIATRTRALVHEARAVNPQVEIMATRKIFPGTKAVAIKAVYAGGGLPHRLGLSESILVFAQHTAFLGGSDGLWSRLPEMKRRAKEKKICVEVDSLREALLAVEAGADMVQVDKMDIHDLTALVSKLREAAPQVLIAAAGGVNQSNAREYAATGVDLLVTSSMYWGKPADIGVTMEAVG